MKPLPSSVDAPDWFRIESSTQASQRSYPLPTPETAIEAAR
ncbi:MAG: CRISPR-associated protein Cas5 [Halodesulfurarchaeum sp.]